MRNNIPPPHPPCENRTGGKGIRKEDYLRRVQAGAKKRGTGDGWGFPHPISLLVRTSPARSFSPGLASSLSSPNLFFPFFFFPVSLRPSPFFPAPFFSDVRVNPLFFFFPPPKPPRSVPRFGACDRSKMPISKKKEKILWRKDGKWEMGGEKGMRKNGYFV